MNKEWVNDITGLGGFPVYILALLLFFVNGYIKQTLQLFTGFLLFYIIIMLIKVFYFKSRPKKRKYNSFFGKMDASSFPSLHTARVTFLATILILFFNNIYTKLIIFFTAGLVCLSRILLKHHDLVDIIGGIVVGAASLIIVLKLNFI